MKKMKKIIGLIFFSLLANSTYSQIDSNLMDSNWKVEKEKIIYGNNIIRLEGKNGIGGVTNVGFKSKDYLIAEIEKKAEREMWPLEKKNSTIELYKDENFGGVAYLYIKRLTLEAANTDKFTVIVKDSNENEIYRKELKSDIPEVPSNDRYWWNYAGTPINVALKGKVYIYIIDRLGNDDNFKFKFEINL
jgi:hypothetical protein